MVIFPLTPDQIIERTARNGSVGILSSILRASSTAQKHYTSPHYELRLSRAA